MEAKKASIVRLALSYRLDRKEQCSAWEVTMLDFGTIQHTNPHVRR